MSLVFTRATLVTTHDLHPLHSSPACTSSFNVQLTHHQHSLEFHKGIHITPLRLIPGEGNWQLDPGLCCILFAKCLWRKDNQVFEGSEFPLKNHMRKIKSLGGSGHSDDRGEPPVFPLLRTVITKPSRPKRQVLTPVSLSFQPSRPRPTRTSPRGRPASTTPTTRCAST